MCFFDIIREKKTIFLYTNKTNHIEFNMLNKGVKLLTSVEAMFTIHCHRAAIFSSMTRYCGQFYL